MPWKQHAHHLDKRNLGERVFVAVLADYKKLESDLNGTILKREEESLEAARPSPSRTDAITPKN